MGSRPVRRSRARTANTAPRRPERSVGSAQARWLARARRIHGARRYSDQRLAAAAWRSKAAGVPTAGASSSASGPLATDPRDSARLLRHAKLAIARSSPRSAGGGQACWPAARRPIGIRTADPLEVQRYLTRSALTDHAAERLLAEPAATLRPAGDVRERSRRRAREAARGRARGGPAAERALRAGRALLPARPADAAAGGLRGGGGLQLCAALPRDRARAARRARSARADRRGPLQPRADVRVQAHAGGHHRARRQRRGRAAVRAPQRDVPRRTCSS